MKCYSICLINKSTGTIEHIAVSDLPLNDDLVGKPSGHENTHMLTRFEFDADKMPRAKEVLAEIEMKGKTVKEKLAMASVKSNSGRIQILSE